MKKNGLTKIFLSLAIFIFGILATIAFLHTNGYLGNNTTTNDNGSCYTKCTNKVTITDTGIADAVDKVYDAVVTIQTYKNNKLISSGTGFVYKVDANYGYIITNYHVINNHDKVTIIRSDEKEVTAKYLGGEQYLDIAVLSISKDEVLKVAEIGSSENSRLGDTVFTIGSPVGSEYMGTVTRGILSGKDRLVSVSLSGTIEDYVMSVLQTDAAINPGNSGGPLLNSNGEVIGVNSLKLVQEEVEGMGFALPIEYVMNNINNLEKGQDLTRPYVGINMANITDTYNLYKEGITIPKDVTSGVVVVSVVESSPAYNKLKKGDIITKINGNDTINIAHFRYELYKHNTNDTITLTYIRNNKTETVKITLQKLPNE